MDWCSSDPAPFVPYTVDPLRASAGRFRVTFKITVDAMYAPCFPICTYIPRFVYDFETGFSLAVSLRQPSVAGDEIAANTR